MWRAGESDTSGEKENKTKHEHMKVGKKGVKSEKMRNGVSNSGVQFLYDRYFVCLEIEVQYIRCPGSGIDT